MPRNLNVESRIPILFGPIVPLVLNVAASFILAVILSTSLSAQEAGNEPSPSPEANQTNETGDERSSGPLLDPAGSGTDTSVRGEAVGPENEGSSVPPGTVRDAEAPEVAAASEPAPSLFEDPAGAISRFLSPVERDPGLPHDLSPLGMFMAADIVVRSVMIGLALASLVTWTIGLAKSLELAGAKARARRILRAVLLADNLQDADRAVVRRKSAAALLVHAAAHEMERSSSALDHAGGQGLLQRVASHLTRLEAQAGRRMTRGTGILATIGSTAPFVGLFGTVWGIMNAFIGISEAQTTNLAVVAPGIAEALLATAFGLVAAIPAVVIYNVFARSTAGYRQLLADTSAAVERLVSRDLDYRKTPIATMPKAAE